MTVIYPSILILGSGTASRLTEPYNRVVLSNHSSRLRRRQEGRKSSAHPFHLRTTKNNDPRLEECDLLGMKLPNASPDTRRPESTLSWSHIAGQSGSSVKVYSVA